LSGTLLVMPTLPTTLLHAFFKTRPLPHPHVCGDSSRAWF
jgi:hypothetical protein